MQLTCNQDYDQIPDWYCWQNLSYSGRLTPAYLIFKMNDEVYLFLQKILALFLLILISPLLTVLFILIKLSSKGPFVFKQKRVGKNMKIFVMYKIRTMVKGAELLQKKLVHLNEAEKPTFKIKNDPRFTRMGKFLSKTGLDEIPQLMNIIKGDMVFVGPRPLPLNEAKKVPLKYSKRFDVIPGITSLWVVKGNHKLSFDKWMELDIDYISKKNLIIDIQILWLTFFLVLKAFLYNLIEVFTKSKK